MIRRGTDWGTPAVAPPDLVVGGADWDIAAVVAARPGARIALESSGSSDIARCAGVTGTGGPISAATTDLPFDAIDLDDGTLVVNAVVLGVAPDRLARRHRRVPTEVHVDGREVFDGSATTVVVATGQYLRGGDVVPRGHPGDGRIEVQVYALEPGQRPRMRRRLGGGEHVPHPAIVEASGRRVSVSAARARPVELDGLRVRARSELIATVRPGAWYLVV